jgi:hypothetical protein
VLEATSNLSWHRQTYLDSKMGVYRIDISLSSASSDTSFSGDFDSKVKDLQWAYENNVTDMIIMDYTPQFLANFTLK